MSGWSTEVVARRAGVDPATITRLTQLGILTPKRDGYSDADVRRVHVVDVLERADLPVDALAALVRNGQVSLDFLDTAGYQVFGALTETTFRRLGEETGVPVEVLLVLREVTGGTRAHPDDLVRDHELEIAPLLALQHDLGFRAAAIERALRVYGESLRRIAEAEAEWWRSEIQDPMLAAGATADEVGRRAGETSPALSAASDRAVIAVYHAQQRHVWSTNIVAGIAAALEQAGMRRREVRHPVVGFLDLTGYTQLTQEVGDVAAAELTERLTRVVGRIAVEHGGRAVKWLGDGVMLYFPDPVRGVVRAALEMVEALAATDLPPAHVGLDAGPVVVQRGDLFGQTVNLAARIGAYARPGEVLVSRSVIASGEHPGIRFVPVGMVELKGITGTVELSAAQRA
jgi:adenylate cyclase